MLEAFEAMNLVKKVTKYKVITNISKKGDYLLFDSKPEADEWIVKTGAKFEVIPVTGHIETKSSRAGMLSARSQKVFVEDENFLEQWDRVINPNHFTDKKRIGDIYKAEEPDGDFTFYEITEPPDYVKLKSGELYVTSRTPYVTSLFGQVETAGIIKERKLLPLTKKEIREVIPELKDAQKRGLERSQTWVRTKKKKYKRVKQGFAFTRKGETYWSADKEALIELRSQKKKFKGLRITKTPYHKDYNEVEFDKEKKYHKHWVRVSGKKFQNYYWHPVSVKHRNIFSQRRHDLKTGKLWRWIKRKGLPRVDSSVERYEKEVLRKKISSKKKPKKKPIV